MKSGRNDNGGNEGVSTYLCGMPNRLINEQSPYLLQHAQNPVDWYPWGDEAFNRAKKENKPVLVSIGYAACHWCHVMEHESFENEEVAAFMNEHFVCIKVDREEHPDVDHMYMDAVQAIAGNGGWPLNVFVTPDRAPFYGGTYFPPRAGYNRPSWMQLLGRMYEIWTEQQDEVLAQSEQLITHLKQASLRLTAHDTKIPDADAGRKIADSLLKQADKEKGGFGHAPKFPGTMAISFLLEHFKFTGYEPALKHALVSLDAMIAGGIYDQLGGGFARYSTDREWLAPHFEKMLYDNALLVCSLCDAYSVTKDDKYKRITEEIIAFVERELKDASGGYYCAIDADSEGEEGKFYTWQYEEWLGAFEGQETKENGGWCDELSRVVSEAYFGVRPEGNWEGTNILHVAVDIAAAAAGNNITVEDATQRIDAVKRLLMAVRDKRERPITDDKCLLSWNALMSIALSKAGVVFYESDRSLSEGYLKRADEHMDWMIAQYKKDGKWYHNWKNGIAKIPAKLDDLAYLAHAMLQLGSATGNNARVLMAAELVQGIIADFGADNGMFYYTPVNQKDIPVRKVDVYDGATPSANAVMANNLWICGACMEKSEWIAQSELMINSMAETITRHSYSFGYWGQLLGRQIKGQKTVVCAGSGANETRLEIAGKYLPQAYLLTLQKEISDLPILENKFFADKMYIFVCSGHACLSPEVNVEAVMRVLEG